MKIAKLELENVKRVKAMTLEPNQNGLTVIGGRNGQGKTSILDAIAWALGGNKYAPSNAKRDGSVVPPTLRVVLDNGITVERKGEKGALKVTDPQGKRAGQGLLDAFVEKLAIDLPKFMSMTSKEKCKVLLGITGVEDELARLECEEQSTYNKRHEVGRMAYSKQKHADEMQCYDGVPGAVLSISELIQQQQAILARNAENNRLRSAYDDLCKKNDSIAREIEDHQRAIDDLQAKQGTLAERLAAGKKTIEGLQDEDSAEVVQSIQHIEELNHKIRANLDKQKAVEEGNKLADEYNDLTVAVDEIRSKKIKLLDSVQMPLPNLSVDNGELIYNGKEWDCMSGSEQLRVSVSIVQKLNPECKFVLVDKLEQMDIETMCEFGAWLTEQGLQAICTRVSTGAECEIIIEDGEVKGQEKTVPAWSEEGEF